MMLEDFVDIITSEEELSVIFVLMAFVLQWNLINRIIRVFTFEYDTVTTKRTATKGTVIPQQQ